MNKDLTKSFIKCGPFLVSNYPDKGYYTVGKEIPGGLKVLPIWHNNLQADLSRKYLKNYFENQSESKKSL